MLVQQLHDTFTVVSTSYVHSTYTLPIYNWTPAIIQCFEQRFVVETESRERESRVAVRMIILPFYFKQSTENVRKKRKRECERVRFHKNLDVFYHLKIYIILFIIFCFVLFYFITIYSNVFYSILIHYIPFPILLTWAIHQ